VPAPTARSSTARLLLGGGAVVALGTAAIYFAATRPAPPALPSASPEVASVAPTFPAPQPLEPELPATITASPRALAIATGRPEPIPESEDEAPKSRHARITIRAGEPIPELFPHQKERDQLYSLAATYDPKNIPAIAASLDHADADVRDSARLALIQLGSAAAAEPLRRAAARASDPKEAEALRESATFLELPTFSGASGLVTSGANPAPPSGTSSPFEKIADEGAGQSVPP
jgi:hypothetical protein